MMSQDGVDSSSEELCSSPNHQVRLSHAGGGSGYHGSPTREPVWKQLCTHCRRLFHKMDQGICNTQSSCWFIQCMKLQHCLYTFEWEAF